MAVTFRNLDKVSNFIGVNNKFVGDFNTLNYITDNLIPGVINNGLDSFLEGTLKLLNIERSSIMLKDYSNNHLYIHSSKGIDEKIANKVKVTIGEGISGTVASTGKPLFVSDVQTVITRKSNSDYKSNSAISIPLKMKEHVFGVMNFNDKVNGDEFTHDDFKLAVVIGNQVSISLYKEKLSQDSNSNETFKPFYTKKTANIDKNSNMNFSVLDLISDINNKIITSNDINELLTTIINESTTLLGTGRGSVMMYDEESSFLKIWVAKGISDNIVRNTAIKPGDGVAGKVFSNKKPLLIKNFKNQIDNDGYTSKSAISVPLRIKSKTLGVLNFNNKENNEDFNEQDLFIAIMIANQASIAIYNSMLLADSLKAQKATQTLELTKKIQDRFKPFEQPLLKNYNIAGFSKPCDEIGGDYYDYVNIDKEKMGIVIGDISGHGLDVGLQMATARAFLKAYFENYSDISSMLFKVNNLLQYDMGDSCFMTLILGILDHEKNSFQYSSAGHISTLHWKDADEEFNELKSTALPMGILKDTIYPSSDKIMINKNDILVFTTDGICEAMDKNGHFFGLERLKEVVKSYIHLSAMEIIKKVKEEIKQFSENMPQIDDMSIIVLKRV